MTRTFPSRSFFSSTVQLLDPQARERLLQLVARRGRPLAAQVWLDHVGTYERCEVCEETSAALVPCDRCQRRVCAGCTDRVTYVPTDESSDGPRGQLRLCLDCSDDELASQAHAFEPAAQQIGGGR